MIQAIVAYLNSHLGVVIAVGLPIFNVVMTALAKVFEILGKEEPGVLKSIGDIGLKIAQWLMANPPTPAPVVQASLDKLDAAKVQAPTQ